MHMLRRTALPIALVLIAGCAKIRPITAPNPSSGTANFTTIVALGTSLSAGFQSGGLVQRHQAFAFPFLFAQQAGSRSFSYPTVNLDGWPPLLKIESLGPPLVVDTLTSQRGAWINPALPYNDMGVPGALLDDVLDLGLNYNPFLPRDVSFFNNILGQGQATIPLSMLQLATSMKPTFISFEFGSNELLGSALHGSSALGLLSDTGVWPGILHRTLDSLDIYIPQAKKVIFNVPDVTSLPYFHTLPIVELDRAGNPVVGLGGPKLLIGVAPGDLVGLNGSKLMAGIPPDSGAYGYALGDTSYLSGFAIPGNGKPLPDSAVLSTSEQGDLQAAVAAYNSAITLEAQARGYLMFDLHGLYGQITAAGFHFAGNTYTTKYVSGGLFSLDGVHPTDLGHGIICNRLIDLVNTRYGAHVPPLDLSQCMTPSSSSLAQSRGGGRLPPLAGAALVRSGYVLP